MANKWIQLMSADGTDNLFPVGKIDLLWTNSAPTSQFSGQTIPLTLTGYRFVLITYYFYTGHTTHFTALIPVNGTEYAIQAVGNTISSRKVTANTSGVTFANGEYVATYSANSYTSTNGVCIPQKIYGIK